MSKLRAALDRHWGATVLLGGHEPRLDPNGDWLPSQFLLLQPTRLSWLLLQIAHPKRTAATGLLPVRFAVGPATHRCEVWGGNICNYLPALIYIYIWCVCIYIYIMHVYLFIYLSIYLLCERKWGMKLCVTRFLFGGGRLWTGHFASSQPRLWVGLVFLHPSTQAHPCIVAYGTRLLRKTIPKNSWSACLEC